MFQLIYFQPSFWVCVTLPSLAVLSDDTQWAWAILFRNSFLLCQPPLSKWKAVRKLKSCCHGNWSPIRPGNSVNMACVFSFYARISRLSLCSVGIHGWTLFPDTDGQVSSLTGEIKFWDGCHSFWRPLTILGRCIQNPACQYVWLKIYFSTWWFPGIMDLWFPHIT